MDPTDHYPPSRLPPLPKPVQHRAGTRWRLNAASGLHKGDRPYQQDQLRVIAHPRVQGCVLAVIADGMGGKSGGGGRNKQRGRGGFGGGGQRGGGYGR